MTSPDRGALVEAIIHLARTLDLDLVVEGIESKAQNQRLRAMGCRLAQGFFYSRPIAPEDIDLLLHDQVRYESVVTPITAAVGPSHPRGQERPRRTDLESLSHGVESAVTDLNRQGTIRRGHR